MGKKKTKTKQVNKPVYSNEIGAASRANQAAYLSALPGINAIAERGTEAAQGLFDDYAAGDPTIQSAQGYVQDLLALEPGANPYLDQMIADANDDTRRQLQTQIGTRGGIGGSSEYNILANALSRQSNDLRYQDYGAQMDRQARAASMAPGLLAGSLIPLDAAMRVGNQSAMLPLQASALNSASTAGLLGQYQNTEGTQTQSGGLLGSIIGAGIGGLAGNPAAFKGIFG
jgi:hypothetical protein